MTLTRFAAVGGTVIFALSVAAAGQSPVRARDLGVPFDGAPGPLNAITDVPGTTVGHTTVIRDLPPTGGKPAAVRGRPRLAIQPPTPRRPGTSPCKRRP